MATRGILARENVECMCKHYVKLVKAGRDTHLHGLIERKLEHVPPLHGDEDEDEDKIDADQEDYLLCFNAIVFVSFFSNVK